MRFPIDRSVPDPRTPFRVHLPLHQPEVYRKSTDRWCERGELRVVSGISKFGADYHQQYLAKNPEGYCPNHSCGIPYRSAVSYSGAKA